MTTASGGWTAALHQVVLRIAGWASDGTVHVLREWLAQGRTVDVAQAVVFTAHHNRTPVTREDAATLAAVAEGTDVDLLDVVPRPQLPCLTMSPVHPARDTDRPADGPQSLDLTALPEEHDEVDRAAVHAAHGVAGFQGLWRTWRSPGLATAWPPPKRVYLMQVACDDPDRLPTHAAEMQAALAQAGETHPQVEVFADAGDLPPYQRLALGWSALLATADPTPPIQVAGVFDAIDDTGGPGFSGTRAALADDERDLVLGYLDAGALMLPTTAVMGDVLGDGRPVVPMGFRTDGHWIWSDAATYFLRHHGVAPEAALLAHIRDRRHQPAPVGAVALHRTMAALAAEGLDGDE